MPTTKTTEVKVIVDVDDALKKIAQLQAAADELRTAKPIQISLHLDGKQVAESVSEEVATPKSPVVLRFSGEDIGLIRAGLNKCHRDFTDAESRDDLRRIEAMINAALGSEVGMAEPDAGGSDDYAGSA